MQDAVSPPGSTASGPVTSAPVSALPAWLRLLLRCDPYKALPTRTSVIPDKETPGPRVFPEALTGLAWSISLGEIGQDICEMGC